MTSRHPLPGPASPALPRPEQLPDDLATLKRMILELLATLQQQRHDIDGLRQRLDLLLRRLYGPRGERFDPNQPLLFETGEETPASDIPLSPKETPVPAAPRRRTPSGRRALPENLPRKVVEHQLAESERVCSCGQVRRAIGVEQTEQLDYQPASLFVWQHRIHKYACPACAARLLEAPPATAPAPSETGEVVEEVLGPVVVSAPRPSRPLARGLPGPGLLAYLIASKFADHRVQGEAV